MAINCKIPTPDEYAEVMLDLIDYNKNIVGKPILENSFGNGNILIKIVERYIISAIDLKLNTQKIKEGLENDIYGYELDDELYFTGLKRVEEVANKYGIKNIDWKLFKGDSLESTLLNFEYIVSNPPYITCHDLNEKQRYYLKNNFETCKEGRVDYYYAFIEKSLKSLIQNGKMLYLIPNSILKNVYGKKIREYIKQYVSKIYDYNDINIFKGISISSIMIICEKRKGIQKLEYYNQVSNKKFTINKLKLGDKWIFDYDLGNTGKVKFGDYFKVSNSVATLKNEVFILNSSLYGNNQIIIDGLNLEKELLLNAISPRSMRENKSKTIIFPYKIKQGKIQHFDEDIFKKKYPNVYQYLLMNKKKLDERSCEGNTKWFEYGRTQALESVGKMKLIMPMVLSGNINVYEAGVNDVPYAGYYIVSKKDIPLSIAKCILMSDEFKKYILHIGTKTNKTTYRISCKDIEAFSIEKTMMVVYK